MKSYFALEGVVFLCWAALGVFASGAPPVADPVVWLDAESGIVTDGSGGIERWEDQSGNGHHFEQADETKRPVLESSGFVVNGGDLVLLESNLNGNDTWGGTLGQPFVIDEEIFARRLAAFDHNQDGISGSITVQIRERGDGGTALTSGDDVEGPILAQLTFTTAEPGELEDQWRWKDLAEALTLAPGSYVLTAFGYTGDDRFYESNTTPRGPAGPGVRWTGRGIYSSQSEPGAWPTVVGSAVGRYAGSGNMRYELAAAVREEHPAVRFDGSNDGLLAVDALAVGRPSTVIAVMRPDHNSFGYALQNSSGSHWYISNDRYHAGSTVRLLSPDWSEARVVAMVQTGGDTRAYSNLDDVTLAEGLVGADPGRLALGGGEGRSNNPLACRIAEVIVYDRALGPAELRATQAYLGERYGIFQAPAARPDIAPVGDLGTGDVSVTLTTLTAGAEIRYTLDGGEPDVSSALYGGPFTVSRGTEVRARAFLDGAPASGVASQFYGDAAADAPPLTGALAWLRADRGVETDTDGRVSRWRDLTGNGNDVSQGTSSQRPLARDGLPQGGGVAIRTTSTGEGITRFWPGDSPAPIATRTTTRPRGSRPAWNSSAIRVSARRRETGRL